MRNEHGKCSWCGKPIYMDDGREQIMEGGVVFQYHTDCYTEMQQRPDVTLEGCAIVGED